MNKLVFYLMKQNVHMFKYKIKCSTAKCRGHKYLLTFRSRALYFVFEQLMEKLIFGYSFKNIPMSDNMTYNLKLIEKIEIVLKTMRWKAYFFLSPDKKQGQVNLSSCYFPHIIDVIALFSLLNY